MTQQSGDYVKLLKDRESIRQQIDYLDKQSDDSLQDINNLWDKKNELNSVDNQIKVLENSLLENLDTVNQLSGNLDLEKDAHQLTLIDQINSNLQEVFATTNSTASFEEIWNSEGFAKYREQLEKISSLGLLSPEVLTTNAKYKALLEATGATAEETVQHINSLVEAEGKLKPLDESGTISAINSLNPGIQSMQNIMAALGKDGGFDYSLLDDKTFVDTFSNMGESYTAFIKTLADSPKDMAACQKAANNLLNTWLLSTPAIGDLSEDTAGLASQMLNYMGIANAEAAIDSLLAARHEQLAAEKYYNSTASKALSEASADDIAQIMAEAEAAGISSVYLARLELAKRTANDVKIDTSSDIEQLIALANSANVSAQQMTYLHTIESLQATKEFLEEAGVPRLEAYDKRIEEEKQKLNASLASLPLDAEDFKVPAPPSSYGSSSSAAPSSASRGPQDFDRTDRALQLLKDRRSQLEEMASDSYRSYLGSGPDAVQSILEQMMYYDGEILKKTKADNIQAFEAYQKALAKVPEQYRDLIEHPGEGLETLDPDTADSVEAAAKAYDEYQKTFSDIADIQKQVQDDKEQYYSVSLEQLDRENQAIESQNSLLNARIDLLTASGSVVGASLYESLIDNTDRQIGLAQAKLKAAREKMANLDEAEGSEKAYDLQEEIAQAEESLASFQKVKEEYDKKLLELPIDNLDTVISMYEGIASSIQDWGSSLEASGQKLGASYYQSLIDNGRDMLDQYQDQADLIEEVMDRSGYDPGSENWNELYDRLQSVNSAMSSMVKNLREWNEALLSLPLDSLSSFSDSVKDISDALSDLQSDYDSVISTVTGSIQDEIDRLKEENDAASETYENKIQLLQEQIDLFDKTNEKRQKELAVEQALYDLEQARSQKTTRVIRDGQITYEADADEIRAAEESLAGAKEDLERYQLQEELDGLQEELDSVSETYDAQIEKLEDMAEKWDSIRTDAQGVRDAALTESYLGSGWKETILSGNGDPLYDSFSRMYGQLDQQLADYEEQLASSQHISSLLEAYITSYKEGTISYEAALSGIQDLLSQMNQALSAGDMLENVLAHAGAVQGAGTGAAASSPEALTPSSILESLKASFESSGKQLLASLAQYNENAGMITEYTTSWEQLTDNVASMKDILEDVRDNLEESLEELSDQRYDDEEEIEDDRDEGVTGTVYERPSHNSDATTGPGIGLSYGDGILNGAVGQAGTSDPVSRLKELATRSLSQDEIPIIAHRGEAVLNRAQQEMLLKNFSLALAPLSPLRLPDYSSLPAASSGDNIKDVHISISGVDVHGVKDVNDFIHSMASLSAQAFRQEFNRMF